MPPTFTDDGQTVQHPLELKFNATGWDILCAIEQGFRAQVDVKGQARGLVLAKAAQGTEEPRRHRGCDLARHQWASRLRHHDRGTYDPDGVQERPQWSEPQGLPRTLPRRDPEDPQSTRGRRELTGLSGRRFRGAGCLFNQTGTWDYVFVESGRLARRPNFPDYLVIMQPVPPSPRGVWKGTLEEVLNELSDGVTE